MLITVMQTLDSDLAREVADDLAYDGVAVGISADGTGWLLVQAVLSDRSAPLLRAAGLGECDGCGERRMLKHDDRGSFCRSMCVELQVEGDRWRRKPLLRRR